MLKTHAFSYDYVGDIMKKKVFIIVIFIFIVFFLLTFTLIPSNKTSNYQYVSSTIDLYTIDKDYYVTKTSVYSDDSNIKDLLEIITSDSNSSNLLKKGFLPILPKGTKVLDVKKDEDILKINFSKELLNIEKDLSEKMIESIIYTIFENTDSLGVEISVEGVLLKYLPKTMDSLPTILTKSYGINKSYDIDSYDDINKVLVWFVKEIDNRLYYVPVTKYVNDEKNKIEIIVEALTSKGLYKGNLMSFLNSESKLTFYKLNGKELILCFNEKIYDGSSKVNSVVIDELVNSMFDSLEIDTVKLFVNNVLISTFTR